MKSTVLKNLFLGIGRYFFRGGANAERLLSWDV